MSYKFVDKVLLFVQGGKGGNGSASLRRAKFLPRGGPDGGHGGNGGNVYIVGSRNMNTLSYLATRCKHIAKDGSCGKSNCCHGKNGADIIIKVPIGTQVYDRGGVIKIFDISSEKDKYILAHGGKGGAGNIAMKSSTNRTPRTSMPGKIGEKSYFLLVLKILSDIGIVGMPNAGKSTLLKMSSGANPEIDDRPFTTINPNLGFVEVEKFDGFIMSDHPGLIEKSSTGRGLGHKFLRHLERSRILLHMVDSTNPDFIQNYKIVRKEIKFYSNELHQKTEFVALSKTDLLSPSEIVKRVKALSEVSKSNVYTISSADIKSINKMHYDIYKYLKSIEIE